MTRTGLSRVQQPEAADREAILTLADEAAAADGTSPLNESAALIVAGERPGDFHLSHEDGLLTGFAVADPRERTVVAAVRPSHRRRGIGSRLLAAALEAHPGHSTWAFGTLPAAAALAEHLGLAPVRGLLKLGRRLGDEAVGPVPEGYTIRPFAEEDAAAVVAVNAAAFAHHPEQGKLTLDEFRALTRQDWFSADGLFVAHHGPEVAGFHWTKRHDGETGEVYVLAVHPEHDGQGLGRVLLETGLAHLAEIGCTQVVLYVEADQERVVRLYNSANFNQVNLDTSYARKDG